MERNEVLQQDLDNFVHAYDHVRTHQGKRCQGRTLGQTFTDSLPQARAHHIREPAKAPTTESSPISSSESTTAGAVANQQASAKLAIYGPAEYWDLSTQVPFRTS